jgi:hypothetical protein
MDSADTSKVYAYDRRRFLDFQNLASYIFVCHGPSYGPTVIQEAQAPITLFYAQYFPKEASATAVRSFLPDLRIFTYAIVI